ncbi:hypothetical protein Ahy_Scaffold1g107339 isoform D [Arachis hypogaea]|uniref:Uncharacterized protein n=1 Tax=Arachis hypogaea TaxID=3818 RepID=A0A444WVE9_ARAHY|nr:hypothetical protein Ahy_Scaffold1g107339 isoform D [Arachis hypogaea]
MVLHSSLLPFTHIHSPFLSFSFFNLHAIPTFFNINSFKVLNGLEIGTQEERDLTHKCSGICQMLLLVWILVIGGG